jgi:hypothetical protein
MTATRPFDSVYSQGFVRLAVCSPPRRSGLARGEREQTLDLARCGSINARIALVRPYINEPAYVASACVAPVRRAPGSLALP